MTRTAPTVLVLRLVAAACAVAACLTFAPAARAQTGTTARGEAVIRGGNTIAAREDAINAALRQAIEQEAGARVDSATFVAEHQVIADKVLSKARGYVKRYDVRDEGTSPDGGTYWVTVMAIVDAGPLDRDLAALNVVQHLRERPRLAVLIEVTQPYHHWDDYRAAVRAALEEATYASLRKAEYRLANQGLVQDALRRDEKLVSNSLNDPAAAQALAHRLEAEYVVLVTATTEPPNTLPQNPRVLTSVCNAQANVVARDSGRIVTSASTRGSGGDITPAGAVSRAAKDAGDKLGDKLAREIGAVLTTEVADSSEITIVITRLSSRRHFVMVRQWLGGLEQTRALHEDGYAAGTGTLRVEYAGKATTLADKIAFAHFDEFTLDPASVDQNKILLEVHEDN